VVSPQQKELFCRMTDLRGEHASFSAPDVPSETPWVTDLLEMQRESRHVIEYLKEEIRTVQAGNSWLERERANWQQAAAERDTIIEGLRASFERVESGKAWLDQQRTNWQRAAAERDCVIEQLLERIRSLEQGAGMSI
jgi:chromosome segregation ATPase